MDRGTTARLQRLESLFATYFDLVCGYLLLMLKDASEAERAAQQVFIRAYAADWQRPTVSLFEIAHREAMGRLCGAAPNVHESSPVRSGGGRHAELRVPEWMSDSELLVLIEGLAPPEREVIVLSYMVRLTVDEIAEIVGGEQDGVRRIRARGLSLISSTSYSRCESESTARVA